MLLSKLVIGRACVALGAPLTSGTRPELYDKLNIPIRCEHKWDRLHNIQVNVPFAANHKQTTNGNYFHQNYDKVYFRFC